MHCSAKLLLHARRRPTRAIQSSLATIEKTSFCRGLSDRALLRSDWVELCKLLSSRTLLAFELSSGRLLSDRGFMLDCVQRRWEAAQFATLDLRGDSEFMLLAMQRARTYKVLHFASSQLLADIGFWRLAIQEHCKAITLAGPEIRKDPGLALQAIRCALQQVPDETTTDHSFMIEAVKRDWRLVKLASSQLRSDRNFMLEAVQTTYAVVQHAGTYLRADSDFLVQIAVDKFANGKGACSPLALVAAIRMASEAHYSHDFRNIVLKWVCMDAQVFLEVLRCAPQTLYSQADFIDVMENAAVQHEACLIAWLANCPRSSSQLLQRGDNPFFEFIVGVASRSKCVFEHLMAHGSKRIKRELRSCEFTPHDRGEPLVSGGASCGLVASTPDGLATPFSSAARAPPLRRLAGLIRQFSYDNIMSAKRSDAVLKSMEDMQSILQRRLTPRHSRIFSTKTADYGMRGGEPYYKPCGWQRFALHSNAAKLRAWPVAYHGTTVERAILILADGLRPPSSKDDIVHGQAYSKSKPSVYVSPAIEYAAYPVYAALAEVAEETWLQAVLQVRVRPGKFSKRKASLRGKKYWERRVRFDPNFENWENLEWVVEDGSDIIVTGVLFRELGRNADPALYGQTAAEVTVGAKGPEYEFTRLRLEEYKRNKLFVTA